MSNVEEERRQRGVEGDWICVGAFAGSHGVRGDVRLKSFTDDSQAIFAFDALHKEAGGQTVKMKLLRKAKGDFIVRVDGVADREAAMALRGTRLYVQRAALDQADEDEFYLAELIGLDARDTSGGSIGFVCAVENFGAEDLLELLLNSPIKGLGRHAFIPFRKAFVPVVDVAGGFVEIRLEDWAITQVSERDGDRPDYNAGEGDA